jgi:hypothetical protein
MPGTCIDIEYKSEERYSKISIAYTNDEEYKEINDAVIAINDQAKLDPEIYTTPVSNGKHVMVIEYHDDYDRQGGEICEALMKRLNITTCS